MVKTGRGRAINVQGKERLCFGEWGAFGAEDWGGSGLSEGYCYTQLTTSVIYKANTGVSGTSKCYRNTT